MPYIDSCSPTLAFSEQLLNFAKHSAELLIRRRAKDDPRPERARVGPGVTRLVGTGQRRRVSGAWMMVIYDG